MSPCIPLLALSNVHVVLYVDGWCSSSLSDAEQALWHVTRGVPSGTAGTVPFAFFLQSAVLPCLNSAAVFLVPSGGTQDTLRTLEVVATITTGLNLMVFFLAEAVESDANINFSSLLVINSLLTSHSVDCSCPHLQRKAAFSPALSLLAGMQAHLENSRSLGLWPGAGLSPACQSTWPAHLLRQVLLSCLAETS